MGQSLEAQLSLTATQPGMSEGIGMDADGLARGAVDGHGGRPRWFGGQRQAAWSLVVAADGA
jgi:hypothetical protein